MPRIAPPRRRRPSRRAGPPALAAACVLALAGCGGSGDDGAPAGSGEGGARPASADRAGAGADRSASWAGRGDDTAVLARRTVTGRPPNDPADEDQRVTVDLVVRSLVVRGRTATLRISATARGWRQAEPTDVTTDGPSLYELSPGATTDESAQLIDAVNLRRHLPLRDHDEEPVADMRFAGQGPSGQRIDASWVFAAPPANVDAMDVQIGAWPIFREVPVTRR